MKELFTALSAVQAETGNIVKNSTNPHFNHKYADFNSIHEALTPIVRQNGLVYVFQLIGQSTMRFTVMHIESGEKMEEEVEMIISKPTPHAFGSAVSYYKRYILISFFNLNIIDDDGNAASSMPTQPQNQPQRPQPAPKAVGYPNDIVELNSTLKGISYQEDLYDMYNFYRSTGSQLADVVFQVAQNLPKRN